MHMNFLAKTFRAVTRWSAITLLALALTGCATRKIDWAGRVGNYSFDQAVLEIGLPDKQAKLTDGTLVVEWLTRRSYAYSTPAFGYGGYYGSPYGAPFYPPRIDNYSPDYFLRLTFGPDGELIAWKRFAR